MHTHFAFVRISPTVVSLSLWGQFGLSDAAELQQALTQAYGEDGVFSLLIQAQHLRGIDEEALMALSQFLAKYKELRKNRTLRAAVVTPEGMLGAMLASFFSVMSDDHPTKIFLQADDAAHWLGVPPGLEFCDAQVAEAARNASLLCRLRELLTERPHLSSQTEVAAMLATSQRTMQRRLQEQGTSFERERRLARLRVAKNLLARTDLTVHAIALQIGMPSGHRLSQVFREDASTTPLAWRKHARGITAST